MQMKVKQWTQKLQKSVRIKQENRWAKKKRNMNKEQLIEFKKIFSMCSRINWGMTTKLEGTQWNLTVFIGIDSHQWLKIWGCSCNRRPDRGTDTITKLKIYQRNLLMTSSQVRPLTLSSKRILFLQRRAKAKIVKYIYLLFTYILCLVNDIRREMVTEMKALLNEALYQENPARSLQALNEVFDKIES